MEILLIQLLYLKRTKILKSMNWLILLNFIATLISMAIIQRGFCEANPSDLIAGITLLMVNVICLAFNLMVKDNEHKV